jgi:predicted O-methyltransferase YrrM
MSDPRWRDVERYLCATLLPADPILEAALAASAAAGLPAIEVAPNVGQFLAMLVRLSGARRVLEVGTLGGYSAIWLARALPDGGRLLSLELDPKHAAVAQANLARAGLTERVEIRIGPAAESLERLERERAEPFDFVFIDADKPSNPEYLAAALRLTRPGALIVVDNVVRDGAVVEADSDDPRVRGVRRMNAMIRATPGLRATAIQTVGAKGYDGFAILLRD